MMSALRGESYPTAVYLVVFSFIHSVRVSFVESNVGSHAQGAKNQCSCLEDIKHVIAQMVSKVLCKTNLEFIRFSLIILMINVIEIHLR